MMPPPLSVEYLALVGTSKRNVTAQSAATRSRYSVLSWAKPTGRRALPGLSLLNPTSRRLAPHGDADRPGIVGTYRPTPSAAILHRLDSRSFWRVAGYGIIFIPTHRPKREGMYEQTDRIDADTVAG